MKWINIKKHKPPYDKMVLISTVGDRLQTPPPRLTPHIAARVTTSGKGDVWITDAGDEPIGEITHWMPLPDSPKDDESKYSGREQRKKVGYNFLHTHPQTEKSLGLDEKHVIVDRDEWEQVVNILRITPCP